VVAVGAGGLEQGAAGTDAAHPCLFCEREPVQGTQLVDDRRSKVVGVVVDEAFPAADAVGVTDGSSQGHAPGHRLTARAQDRGRLAGVHPAGDKGRAQQRPQAAVGLGGSFSQTMPHFGCQVDVHVWGIYPFALAREVES